MKIATESSSAQEPFYRGTAQNNWAAQPGSLIAKHPWQFLMVILVILTFWVFLISPITGTSDAMYSMVSESILHHFSSHLNWFHPPGPVGDGSAPPVGAPKDITVTTGDTYQLGRVHGNLVYRYPNGSSLLSLPFVAVANLYGLSAVTRDGDYHRGGDFVIQRIIAALLMAILVALVFRTSTILLDAKTSLLIALGFAFGTPVWSEATRQLWSHT